MNPLTQPDRHPDAESLNAFAEQALPPVERTRIVAHMAGCARCREVVYLAQAAAEAEAAPVAGVQREPRPGWIAVALAKWRVALIPAVALAATGAVVLWVQLRPPPPRAEMAQLAPQPSPQLAAPAAAPKADRATAPSTPEPPSALSPSTAHKSKPPEQPEQKKAKPASPGLAAAGVSSSEQEARNAAVPAAAESLGSSRVMGGYHLDAHSAAMARRAAPEPPNGTAQMAFEPALTTALLPQQQTAKMSPAARSGAMAAEPAPAPVPPNIVTVQRTVAVPASGGPEPLTAKTGPAPVQLAPQALNGFRVMTLARHAKLPSGLNIVSAAAMLNRLLAVDSAGALFLSQDAGKHWEAVHPQWTGKAITVQAPPQGLYQLMSGGGPESLETSSIALPSPEETPSNPNPNAKASAAPPAPPPPVSGSAVTITGAAPPNPAMLFKLVTDRRQTWVSADGKVWHER